MIVTSFESSQPGKCWRCKKQLAIGSTVGMDFRYNTYCTDCTMVLQEEQQFERDVINEVEEPETE